MKSSSTEKSKYILYLSSIQPKTIQPFKKKLIDYKRSIPKSEESTPSPKNIFPGG